MFNHCFDVFFGLGLLTSQLTFPHNRKYHTSFNSIKWCFHDIFHDPSTFKSKARNKGMIELANECDETRKAFS